METERVSRDTSARTGDRTTRLIVHRTVREVDASAAGCEDVPGICHIAGGPAEVYAKIDAANRTTILIDDDTATRHADARVDAFDQTGIGECGRVERRNPPAVGRSTDHGTGEIDD